MATQYFPDTHPTNTSGWSATSGVTISASAEGIRIRKAAGNTGEVRAPNFNPPSNFKPAWTGLRYRRNTSTTVGIAYRMQAGQYDFLPTLGTINSTGAVGAWVRLPRIIANQNLGAAGGGDAAACWTYFTLPSGPVDITLDNLDIYNANDSGLPASAALDSDDAGMVFTIPPNSLTITAKHDALNNEGVNGLSISWGDGGFGNNQSLPYTTATTFPALTHTFPRAGIFNVRVTASHEGGYDYTRTYSLSIPSGTFTADYEYQANYLSVDVDGSSSVAPSNDPVDQYIWNWGDSSPTETGKQAQHTYAQAGTYNVALTIKTNETLRTHTLTKSVLVTAPPSPDNYFVTDVDLLEVSFNPSIQDGTSYSWNFGDGEVSTDKQPVHVYGSPGTYTVALTVNGDLNASQQVTVVDAYRPLENLSDALSLEVALPQPEGAIYNRLPNPDGAQGAYGWITPVANSFMIGSSTTNQPKDKAVPGSKLIYTSSGAGTQQFHSTPVTVTAGQYVNAQFVSTYVDGVYRVCVEALNAAGAVIGTSTQTGYLSALGTPQRVPAYLLPAGTSKARVRVNHYSNASNGVPANGKILHLRRVMLAQAPTAAELASNPYLEFENWIDVLGPTSQINIDRQALDVGTFNAEILDASLDPATSDSIRPGRSVRLRSAVYNSAGQATIENLYVGTITAANTDYTGKGTYTDKDTRITISAVDNISKLASTSENRGVARISELPEVLETAAIPYEVNGSSGQAQVAQVVAVNDNATTLDQIAITRDSNQGYAFVNRNNVLIARDPQNMSTIPAAVVDEAYYSGIKSAFSTSKCYNSVNIKWLRTTGDQTEEINYGPYEDLDSQAEWGLRPITFTMQGVENTNTIGAKAQAILSANSVPVQYLDNVTIPIRNLEDLTRSKVLLDLYDLVELRYERNNTVQLVRITGIRHTITPNKWLMELTFDVEGNVASPQVVPAPPVSLNLTNGSFKGSDPDFAWTDGWSQFDDGSNAVVYAREGRVHTLAGAVRRTAAATLGTTTYIATINDALYVPPSATVDVYSWSNTGIALRFRIYPDKRIGILKAPQSSSWSWPAGDYFTFTATWIA